ncbi:MAG: hypothetical protein PBV01_11625 [Brucella anthropi]
MHKRRQLISSDEAVKGTVQHKRPCSDCPWSRQSLNGWLGGVSAEEWLKRAHSNTFVNCHVIDNMQCAGLAIYRRNVCKRVETPLLTLDADKAACFATPKEFTEHHTKTWSKRDDDI